MAVSESTTYAATAFSLRGVELDVTHTIGGKAITRTAIVDASPTTFLDRGSTRKTSAATCTFLEAVGVSLEDTITLPDGEPMKVLKVTSRYGLTVQHDGFLTETLLV